MANPFDLINLDATPVSPYAAINIPDEGASDTIAALAALRKASQQEAVSDALFSTGSVAGTAANTALAAGAGASTAVGNLIAGTVLDQQPTLADDDVVAYNYVQQADAKAKAGDASMQKDPKYLAYQEQLDQPYFAEDATISTLDAQGKEQPIIRKAVLSQMTPAEKARFVMSLTPEEQRLVNASDTPKRAIAEQTLQSYEKARDVTEFFGKPGTLVNRAAQEEMMANIAYATQEVAPQMQSAEQLMSGAVDSFMDNPNMGAVSDALVGASQWAQAFSRPLEEGIHTGALPVFAESIGRQVAAAALTGGNVPASIAVAGSSAYTGNMLEAIKARQEDTGNALLTSEEMSDTRFHSAVAAALDAGTQGAALALLKKAAAAPKLAAAAAAGTPAAKAAVPAVMKALKTAATIPGIASIEGVEEALTTYHEEAAKGREATREQLVTSAVLGAGMGAGMAGGLGAIEAGASAGRAGAAKAAATIAAKAKAKRNIRQDTTAIDEALTGATAEQAELVKNIADGNTTLEMIDAKLAELNQDPEANAERIEKAQAFRDQHTEWLAGQTTRLDEVNQSITQMTGERKAAFESMAPEAKTAALKAEEKAKELADVEQRLQGATGDVRTELEAQAETLRTEAETLATEARAAATTAQQEIFGSHDMDLSILSNEELQAMKSWDLTEVQQMAIDFQTQVNSIQDRVDAVSKNIFQGGQSSALKRNVKGLNDHMTDIVKSLQDNDMAAAQESLTALEKFSAGHKTRAETFKKAFEESIATGKSIKLDMKTTDGRDYVIHPNSGKLVEAANNESRLLASAANKAAEVLNKIVAPEAAPTGTPEVTPAEAIAPEVEALNADLEASTGLPTSVLEMIPLEQRQRLADIFGVAAPEVAPTTAPAKPKTKSQVKKEKLAAAKKKPEPVVEPTVEPTKEQKLAEAKAGRVVKQEALAEEVTVSEAEAAAQAIQAERDATAAKQAEEAELAIRSQAVPAEGISNHVGEQVVLHDMRTGKSVTGKLRSVEGGVITMGTGMFNRGTRKFPVSELESGDLVLTSQPVEAVDPANTLVPKLKTRTTATGHNTVLDNFSFKTRPTTPPTLSGEEQIAHDRLEASITNMVETLMKSFMDSMYYLRSEQTAQPEMIQNNPLDAFINADGKLDPEVVRAIAEGIHHWAAVESVNLDALDESQAIKAYGIVEVDTGAAPETLPTTDILNALRYKGAMPSYIGESLGVHIVRALGMQKKDNARNNGAMEEMTSTLGKVGLDAMSYGNLITQDTWNTSSVTAMLTNAEMESTSINNDEITTYRTAYRNKEGEVVPNTNLAGVREVAKGSMQTFDRYADGDLDSDLPLNEKSKTIPTSISGTNGMQKVSAAVQGQMAKANRVAWELVKDITDFLSMGIFGTDNVILRDLFGFTPKARMDELLPAYRAAAESRNNTLDRELNNLRTMAARGKPFYYRYNIMRNMRQNMGSYGFSPQASKLVRYLVGIVGTNETIRAEDMPTDAYDVAERLKSLDEGKTTNQDPVLKFLGRLGNNLDLEFDNTLPADVVKGALAITQTADFQAALAAINGLRTLEAQNSKDLTQIARHVNSLKAILTTVKPFKKLPPAQAMRSLLAWDAYTKAIANKQSFDYSLWLEIDGKTNGIGFATSQFTAHEALATILGQRVGTLTGTAATLAELKKEDKSFQDGYQSIAKALIEEIEAGETAARIAYDAAVAEGKKGKALDPYINEVKRAISAKDAWTALTSIAGDMAINPDGSVSSSARSAVKPLLMTIATYGAGANTAMKVFAGDVVVEGIYKDIQEALDSGNNDTIRETVPTLLEGLSNLLNDQFDTKTPKQTFTLINQNGEPYVRRSSDGKATALKDFELSGQERKTLNKRMAEMFAKPVNAAINRDYGAMRHGKDTLVGGINTAAEVYVAAHNYIMEEVYKTKFEEAGKPYKTAKNTEADAYKKFKKVTKLTAEEYREIRDALASLEPRLYTPAADPKDKSTWVLMLGQGKGQAEVQPQIARDKNKGKGKVNAGFTSVPTKKVEPVGPGASVAAMSIQTLDALIQSVTMNRAPHLLNEFDALGYPASTSYDAYSTPNRAFHATMTQYDLPQSMLDVYSGAMQFLSSADGMNAIRERLNMPALTEEQFRTSMLDALGTGKESAIAKQYKRMGSSFEALTGTEFFKQQSKVTAPSLAEAETSVDILSNPTANVDTLQGMVDAYRDNREAYNDSLSFVSQYNADRQVVTTISDVYQPLSLASENSAAAKGAPKGKPGKPNPNSQATHSVSEKTAANEAANQATNTMEATQQMGGKNAHEGKADITQNSHTNSAPGVQAQLGSESLTVAATSLEAIFDKLSTNPAAVIRDSAEHITHLKEVLGDYIKLGGKQISMTLTTVLGATSSGQITGADMSIIQALYGPTNIPQSTVGELRISAAEAYVHELVHFVSNVALNKDFRLRTKMQSFWKSAREEALKPQNAMFYAQNQEMFDRVFHPSANAQGKAQYLHEFMAYGVTNDAMRQLLSQVQASREQSKWFEGRNLSEKLTHAFQKMLDVFNRTIRKKSKGNLDAEMMDMLRHAANIEARNRSYANHIISKGMQLLNTKMTQYTPKLHSIINHGVTKWKPGTSRIAVWAKTPLNMASLALNWTRAPQAAQAISKQITNGVHYLHRSQNIFLKELGMLASEMATVHDKNAWIVDASRRAKAAIDRNRVDIATSHSNNLRSVFEELSDAESEALTYVLGKADLAALMEPMMTWTELADFVTNPAVRAQAIRDDEEALDQLVGKKNTFYKLQAKNLGQYMMTNLSSLKAARLNAYTISRGPKTQAADPAIEAIVDRLATLYALNHVPAPHMQAAIQVINREIGRSVENNGFSTALSLFLKVRADSIKHFDGQRDSMLKGYVNESFDERISLMMSDIVDDTSLKSQGYTLVRRLPVDDTIPGQSGKFLYMNPYGGTERFMAGALSLQQAGRKGTSFTIPGGTQQTARDAFDAGLAAKEAHDLNVYRNGFLPPIRDEVNTIPVYGIDGRIMDFRYVMSDATKNSLLKKENKLDKVLPATVANIETIPLIDGQNQKVIDAVFKTFNQFFVGNESEFVEISPFSADEELREHWNMLPKAAKKYAEQKFGSKRLMVRRPELVTVFGRRAYTSREIWEKQASERNIVETVYYHTLRQFFGDKATHRIRQASDGMATFVQYAKDILVVKSFVMSFANTLSNVALLGMNGISAVKYFANYSTVFSAYQQYMTDTQRKHVLEGQLANPTLTAAKRRSIEGELAIIADNYRNSPIYHMVEAGMVQSIEDLGEAQGDKLFEGVPILEKLNDIDTSSVPGWAKTGFKNLTIMRDSSTYRTLRDFAVMGDFVAKYTLIQQRMESAKKGKRPMTLDQAVREAGDLFIDYSLPTGLITQTMNDMGFAFFTKYAVRLPKHVINTLRHNPMEAVLYGVVANAMGISTVFDSLRLITDPVSLLGNPLDAMAFMDEGITTEAMSGLVKTFTN